MNEQTTRILTVIAQWQETLENDYAPPATDIAAFCNALLVADEKSAQELIDLAEKAQQDYYDWKAVPAAYWNERTERFVVSSQSQRALFDAIDRIQRAAI